jgi:outer membrane cobalamin receptor
VPLGYRTGSLVAELRFSQNERDDYFADPNTGEVNDTDARVRNARGLVSMPLGSLGTLTFGGEYETSLVDHVSSFSMIDERQRSSESFFVEDRLSMPIGASSFEMTAGVRYDNYDTFGSETTPRLAAAWATGAHKLRAGYGRAFRAPAIGELYSPFFGNAELEAETSRSFEVGYDFTGTLTSFSLTWFDSEYEELIAFGPSFTFENIDVARARGMELSLRHQIGGWQFGGSYANLDTEDAESGAELIRRPKHSGSAFVGYLGGAWQSMLVITHRGERLDVTDIAPFGTVGAPSFTTADLTIRYRVGSLVPYVKAENITDEDYEEVFGYASPARRLIAGVRYNWGR